MNRNRNARDEAIRYRKERLKEIALRGQGPATRQQRLEVERQVEARQAEYETLAEQLFAMREELDALRTMGFDPVEVDRRGAELLGLRWQEIEHLRRAEEGTVAGASVRGPGRPG